jgi:NADH:ubiquinone oxidoreductase subunit 6 (subunit J)
MNPFMVLFLGITDPSHGETLLTLLRAYWPLWVTAALGFLGLYGLLPQARTSKPIWSGLAAALAILLAGLWIVRQDGVWPEQVLFYAFSLLAILGGNLMLAQSNPVHAALSFALVVLSTCGLFLLLAAPFLMAATIIIYAGAIVVTFLFVIMLAQQAGLASADARSREPFLASLAGFVLLGTLWCVLDKTYNLAPVLRELDQVARAKSLEEVGKLWGAPAPNAEARTLPALERLKSALPRELEYDVPELEKAWAKKDLAALTKAAARLRDQAAKVQVGVVKPRDREAPVEAPVTAHNVAGLGRTLFTRYLVPVELAGVLLLVATIGAIAIAGRRGEGLR